MAGTGADSRPPEGGQDRPGVDLGPVLGPRASRIHLAQALAVGLAVVAILALGFGIAGQGRDRGPTPVPAATSTAAAGASGTPDVSPPIGTPAATATTSPRPMLAVIPAVPCNDRPPALPLLVSLILDGGATITGSPDGAAPLPEVEVPLGARVLLILGAEDCAVGWDIRVAAAAPRLAIVLAHRSNPAGDLSFGFQNRWDLTPLPVGEYVLSADLDLGQGLIVRSSWRIHGLAKPAGFG